MTIQEQLKGMIGHGTYINTMGYQQALDNAYQRALYSGYQLKNYNPMTADIDAKLLEARLKQNRAKHKIQDMTL